jgi:hypothetical protein
MGKDGIQTFKEKPYYKAGTEQFHEYMVKSIADILYLNGINFKIEPTGRSIADITGEDFVIEAETGSKRRTNDLKQRMERYKNEGRFAYIIVPNAEVQKMYPNSFTIPEFAEMIEKTILANSKEEVKQSE